MVESFSPGESTQPVELSSSLISSNLPTLVSNACPLHDSFGDLSRTPDLTSTIFLCHLFFVLSLLQLLSSLLASSPLSQLTGLGGLHMSKPIFFNLSGVNLKGQRHLSLLIEVLVW